MKNEYGALVKGKTKVLEEKKMYHWHFTHHESHIMSMMIWPPQPS
jgi:hypothetical protein